MEARAGCGDVVAGSEVRRVDDRLSGEGARVGLEVGIEGQTLHATPHCQGAGDRAREIEVGVHRVQRGNGKGTHGRFEVHHRNRGVSVDAPGKGHGIDRAVRRRVIGGDLDCQPGLEASVGPDRHVAAAVPPASRGDDFQQRVVERPGRDRDIGDAARTQTCTAADKVDQGVRLRVGARHHGQLSRDAEAGPGAVEPQISAQQSRDREFARQKALELGGREQVGCDTEFGESDRVSGQEQAIEGDTSAHVQIGFDPGEVNLQAVRRADDPHPAVCDPVIEPLVDPAKVRQGQALQIEVQDGPRPVSVGDALGEPPAHRPGQAEAVRVQAGAVLVQLDVALNVGQVERAAFHGPGERCSLGPRGQVEIGRGQDFHRREVGVDAANVPARAVVVRQDKGAAPDAQPADAQERRVGVGGGGVLGIVGRRVALRQQAAQRDAFTRLGGEVDRHPPNGKIGDRGGTAEKAGHRVARAHRVRHQYGMSRRVAQLDVVQGAPAQKARRSQRSHRERPVDCGSHP